MHCPNLPKIIELTSFNGDYPKYQDYIIKFFKENILNVNFDKKIIKFQNPQNDTTILHIISKNTDGKNREIDLRRCERITWIPHLLQSEDCQQCDQFLVWKKPEPKRNRLRTYVFCANKNYIVVLEEHKNILFLVTAFNVDNHHRTKYINEYNDYLKYT